VPPAGGPSRSGSELTHRRCAADPKLEVRARASHQIRLGRYSNVSTLPLVETGEGRSFEHMQQEIIKGCAALAGLTYLSSHKNFAASFPSCPVSTAKMALLKNIVS
jgi:hypothetical protein